MELENQYERDAAVFKAFCDTNRLKILELLQSGEKCACVLLEQLNIGQSTLSHHMKILCDSGVVSGRREGKWTHYSLNPLGSKEAVRRLWQLTKPNGLAEHFEGGKNMDTEKNMDTKKKTDTEKNMAEGKTKLYILTGFLGSGKTTILFSFWYPSCAAMTFRWWSSTEDRFSVPACASLL